MFDCLHDMGDPAGGRAARRATRWHPAAPGWSSSPWRATGWRTTSTPVGRLFYAASTLVCTPASLAQDGRAALGAQAGEAALTEVIRRGGFSRVRRATETPVNIVLEARP